MIKKLSLVVCFALSVAAIQAQHQVVSFFDELGSARIQTEEFPPSQDTLVKVEHRIDDVIWSRYVYRIIDMRYKQNFPLYFPKTADDATYRNLFKIITDAVVEGLPVYAKNDNTIKPDFKQDPLPKKIIPMMFMADDPTGDYSDDPMHYEVCCSDHMLIHYDSVTDALSTNYYRFDAIVRNQLKYLIQEMVFFDKSTSRLYQKIIAIAPLQADKISTRDNSNIMASLLESVMFWVPFDTLRPYMAKQYMIPSKNETRHVTFDEFFQKRLYTSYIVGEGNMYNAWIPDYSGDAEKVKKEQERIANELLNFEQDLWEY